MFYVKNGPAWERLLRVLAGAGAALLALYFLGGLAGMLVAASAAGLAVTGLMGFCPLCALAGRRLGQGAGK